MTISSVASLVDAVRQARLLKPAQLDELTHQMQPRYSDPRVLARDLVQRGWLTPQQIGQLLQAHPLAVPPVGVPAAAVPAVKPGIPVAAPITATPGVKPGILLGAAKPGVPVAAVPVKKGGTGYHAERARSRRRWLKFNLLAFLVLVIFGGVFAGIFYLQRHAGPAKNDANDAERERQAQTDLQPLLDRFNDAGANSDLLRKELAAFRLRHAGTPQSLKAGEMLMQLPSPLDALNASSVPDPERYEGMAKSIVMILGERRWRHWGPVRQVAFSPDGQTYASTGDDRIVRLWLLKTAEERAALPVEPTLYLGFAGDAKNKYLVAGTTDGKVNLWDSASGEKTTVQGPVKSPTSLAVSPDAKLAVSATDKGPIKLWDRATGKEKASLEGHTSRVMSVVFSADGKYLVSGDANGGVRLWNAQSGETERIYDGHSAAVRCVAFDTDGKTIASGGEDQLVKIWDVETGREKVTLEGIDSIVTAVAFAGTGAFASGSQNGEIRLWDLVKKEARDPLMGHAGPILSLGYNATGTTVLSGSSDGTVRLWTVAADKAEERSFFRGHKAAATSVAFGPEGAILASGSADKTVRLWDPLKGERDRSRGLGEAHKETVTSVAFSPDGTSLLSGSEDRTAKLWNVTLKPGSSSLQERGTFTGQKGDVKAVAFAPDGKTLVVAGGIPAAPAAKQTFGEIKLWDAAIYTDRATNQSTPEVFNAVSFSPDGKTVATAGNDKMIRLWDTEKLQETASFPEAAPVTAVAFSPDGKTLASGTASGTLKLWDVAAKKDRLLSAQGGAVSALLFTPDGKTLLSSQLDGWVMGWDITQGIRLPALGGKVPGAVLGIALAQDGRHLATANSNGTIYIMRLTSHRSRK